MSRRSLLARGSALLAVVVISAGCQVRTDVGLDVHDDGSGVVAVSVALDEDALSRFPGIEDELRLDDLRQAGWEIAGPERDAHGFTRWLATKPFSNPEDAGKVLAEVSGDAGPFRDFRLERQRSFARTRFRFGGAVDLSGGVESFADEELAAALDGKPLGDDRSAFEERIGQTLDRVFQFKVTLRLPGKVTSSNATTEAGNGVVWEPSLSEVGPIMLRAASNSWRVSTLAWAAIALVAFVAMAVIAATMLVRRRRSPS